MVILVMDWDYLVPGVLWLPLLECLQDFVVLLVLMALQPECLLSDLAPQGVAVPLALLVPLLECLQVGWVLAVLVVTLGVGLGDDWENLLLNLLSLSLLLELL